MGSSRRALPAPCHGLCLPEFESAEGVTVVMIEGDGVCERFSLGTVAHTGPIRQYKRQR